ncbi:MAG: DNA (cytosine-5-)-methyltransferase [Gammaproteobacteria bacterium]|nr:MAG: DNA (cytosine-5-)-methyltransferase [Gammaproteobacteria bacterium]
MNRFTSLREQAGLSIKEVAELTGYSERMVYRWENNEITPRPAVIKLLEDRVAKYRTKMAEKPLFRFIDLFAGIGGMRLAFEEAGGQCVFTSEWNKFSRLTYCANFECDHPLAGDITKVHESEIPEHDVLLAGFPCQPFSIAGVSKKNALGKPHGFADKTQGTLFFDIARILAWHKPKAFLLENVKNLESHNKGQTFRIIRETLLELGYHIDWKVIDAKGFVPQHRERIFIAGFRVDSGFRFDLMDLPDPANGPKMKSILHPEDGSEEPEPPYTTGELAKVAEKYTLSDKLWSYLQSYAKKHRERGNGFGFGLVDGESVARTLSARYYKDGSEILVKQQGKNPRRLTPRECSRLMGFDKPGSSEFIIPVSDTQAYRQFGNAVVVPVVAAIARHMLPHITDPEKAREQVRSRKAKVRKVHGYQQELPFHQ